MNEAITNGGARQASASCIRAIGLSRAQGGAGALDRILAACADALAQPGAVSAEAITHVVIAGATQDERDELSALPSALGLPPAIGYTLVSARGGAAGLAGLRIADACCRGPEIARVLVASVGRALQGGHDASAVLLCSLAVPATFDTLRIVRVATLTHREDLGELTLSQGESGFDLEGSDYLEALGTLDLPGLLHDCVGLTADDARRVSWAVHAGHSMLDALERSFDLSPQALGPSRRVLQRHGADSAPAVFFILRGRLDRASGSGVIAAGLGPGPTLEIVRLASELRADAAADRLA